MREIEGETKKTSEMEKEIIHLINLTCSTLSLWGFPWFQMKAVQVRKDSCLCVCVCVSAYRTTVWILSCSCVFQDKVLRADLTDRHIVDGSRLQTVIVI